VKPGPNARPHFAAVALAVVVVAAIAALLERGTDVNYDVEYALSWGRAILDGHAPDFTLDGAPTQHPLTNLLAVVAELLPFDGRATMQAFTFLAYGVLVVSVALVGAEVFSWLAGVAAALTLAVSSSLLPAVAIGFQDVTATALVLVALLLEVRRPRRGVAPLVALGVGGLLRPELWGLAAAYWVAQVAGRSNAERARLALMAAAGPVLWIMSDLIVTGEPLTSFTRTREGAAAAERATGLSEAPKVLLDHLNLGLGRVVVAGGALGAAGAALLAWRGQRLQRLGREVPATVWLVLATLVLTTLAFVALGATRLSLLDRYTFAPAALLSVFFGFTLTAWWHLRPAPLAAIAAILAAVLCVFEFRNAKTQVKRTRDTLVFLRGERRALDDLRGLAASLDPALKRCGSVTVSSYRTRPYLALELDVQPKDIHLEEDPRAAAGPTLYVDPASREVRDAHVLLGSRGVALPSPPPGSKPVAATTGWRANALGC
jgi:hypothetical protein